MPQYQTSLYLVILLLLPYATSKPDGFSLELIHRDSPESPFYPSKLVDSERISRLVQLSEIRAHNLASDLISNSSFSPEALKLGLSNDGVCYLVKVLIGTPGIPLYLLADSGSHLIWTQCEPCTHRYHQLPPIFNSTASHSFRELTCQSPFCSNNHEIFECRSNKCVYNRTFGDGSTTAGVAAQDILQSTANNDRIPFNFGCPRDNRNFPTFASTGKSGGIIGLSMSPVSLVQQLGHITKHRFSYCLNALTGNLPSTATSFLRFGNDIHKRGRKFHSTPFVSPPAKHLYFLNLLDISVGGLRLQFPPGTFALKPDGTGGTIIDSGTSFTFITQPAYVQVIDAFKIYFQHHGFQRVQIPHLDLCYIKARNQTYHNFPSLTFNFEGADFIVQPENVYLDVGDKNAFCLPLKGIASGQHSVIGAINQANTRFIYDAAKRELLFTPENCQHDNGSV